MKFYNRRHHSVSFLSSTNTQNEDAVLRPGFRLWVEGHEKAEEPEIKLPTSAGSQKKQENFRKIPTSASLTTLKLLTVWMTVKQTGKFLKRWEYQTT